VGKGGGVPTAVGETTPSRTMTATSTPGRLPHRGGAKQQKLRAAETVNTQKRRIEFASTTNDPEKSVLK
jgi:hypothetical protein